MAGDVAFTQWLRDYLLSVNPDTDADVFVEYIQSLLSDSEDEEELLESLKEILAQIVDEQDTDKVCEEIRIQYSTHRSESEKNKAARVAPEEQLKAWVAEDKQRVVENTAPVSKPKSEQTGYRYQLSEEEEEDDECSGVMANVNRTSIDSKDKARRAQMKQESQKKKEKDKLDREKQLEKAKSRKESEKQRTQKRERRGR